MIKESGIVNMFTLEKQFIQSFENLREAADFLVKNKHVDLATTAKSGISGAILGNKGSWQYKGFIWGYVEEELDIDIDKYSENKIDLAYFTGVFNTSGIDGLSKEMKRLRDLGVSPHNLFELK